MLFKCHIPETSDFSSLRNIVYTQKMGNKFAFLLYFPHKKSQNFYASNVCKYLVFMFINEFYMILMFCCLCGFDLRLQNNCGLLVREKLLRF